MMLNINKLIVYHDRLFLEIISGYDCQIFNDYEHYYTIGHQYMGFYNPLKKDFQLASYFWLRIAHAYSVDLIEAVWDDVRVQILVKSLLTRNLGIQIRTLE